MRDGWSGIVAYGAIALAVVGMMFVIGGVLAAGLFRAGTLLILVSAPGFAASGVLHVLEERRAG